MSSANPISTITGQTEAGQYGFTDPFGASAAMSSNLFGAQSPLSGGPMGVYNQNLGNVLGLSGPLQGSLSDIASYQARNALNTTAQNFANQGALGSGAAAQAFGQAIANPFAQAQSQLQQGQLGLASSLMGTSANAYANALNAGSNLMEHTSGLVAPQNYTNPAYASQQQGKGSLQGSLQGMASQGGGNLLSSYLGPQATAAGNAAAAGKSPTAAAAPTAGKAGSADLLNAAALAA